MDVRGRAPLTETTGETIKPPDAQWVKGMNMIRKALGISQEAVGISSLCLAMVILVAFLMDGAVNLSHGFFVRNAILFLSGGCVLGFGGVVLIRTSTWSE